MRLLFVGGLYAYRALFNWAGPAMFIGTLLVGPVFQLLFFAYLGRELGIAERRLLHHRQRRPRRVHAVPVSPVRWQSSTNAAWGSRPCAAVPPQPDLTWIGRGLRTPATACLWQRSR